MGNSFGNPIDDTPCLTRIRPQSSPSLSTPKGDNEVGDHCDTFTSYMFDETVRMYRETATFVGNYFLQQAGTSEWIEKTRNLENENRQLRRRINHLETEIEWSRMDAIESHYKTVGSSRRTFKDTTSISMLNLSSDNEDQDRLVRYIPHSNQVTGGKNGDINGQSPLMLPTILIGSIGDEKHTISLSLLDSLPDKENMIPHN